MIAFADLAAHRRWVAWRGEPRDDDITKAPYIGPGIKARADDPSGWITRAQAETLASRIMDGHGGGIGLELGTVADVTLGGVDLDTCRDPTTGKIEPWAQEVIGRLATYSEVSPSGAGIKCYFQYDRADLDALRTVMGGTLGRKWARERKKHAPSIELYLANRYFAVTGEHLVGTPPDLRPVFRDTILWILRDAGPAFRAGGDASAGAYQDGGNDGLHARIKTACDTSPKLAQRWTGDWAGLSDITRSGRAMSLLRLLHEAGFGRDDAKAALRLHHDSDLDAWLAESDGQREFQRAWDKVENSTSASPPEWGEPDMSVLRLNRRPPPKLPLEVFGPEWQTWITNAAEAAACPPDYVAATLLASTSALIGNARWAQANQGWAEPPHLWCGSVGDSGCGKSPGSDALLRHVLPHIEARMAADFPDQLREWRAAAESRTAKTEAWKADVRKAEKDGAAPPLPPIENDEPEPQAPRLRENDVTIEKVAALLASAAPKGLLIWRDELSGWLLGMTNYNSAGRAFWIEAYGGRPYRVERQKSPRPIEVPYLAVAVTGGTQPDKVAELFREADDGLLARFCWFWPDAVPFALGRAVPDTSWAIEALDRLRLLDLARTDDRAAPVMVPLAAAALPAIEAFGREMQESQSNAGGLMRSAYGKARGTALRLSLSLEYLWWCAQSGFDAPPASITERAFMAAATLVADYLMPMAERVYGDAAAARAEHNAATLARWIVSAKAKEVHIRHLLREGRLPGLRDAATIREACDVLVDADWLRPPPKGDGSGRPKAAYAVNPRMFGP